MEVRNVGSWAALDSPGGCLEQHVVIRLRVEMRVEVDEIDQLIPHMLAQDFEVVAKVQLVHPGFEHGVQKDGRIAPRNRFLEPACNSGQARHRTSPSVGTGRACRKCL
jgi:hypothetical protein